MKPHFLFFFFTEILYKLPFGYVSKVHVKEGITCLELGPAVVYYPCCCDKILN